MKTTTPTQSLADRIRAATGDRDALRSREAQILRHYNAGTITAAEFRRLDLMIFERIAKLDP